MLQSSGSLLLYPYIPRYALLVGADRLPCRSVLTMPYSCLVEMEMVWPEVALSHCPFFFSLQRERELAGDIARLELLIL